MTCQLDAGKGIERLSHSCEHIQRNEHMWLRICGTRISTLQAAGVPFTKSQSGRPAIFFRDPDANTVEVGQALGWKDGAAP